MPLQFYGEGKYSEVWLEDRRPDGSAVMLVCGAQKVSRPGESPGPTPVNFVMSTAPDGNAYPHLRELGLVVRELPKVHVDTTDMPGGIQRYFMTLFGRKAVETAEQGVRLVAITPKTAREWGWIPPDEHGSTNSGDTPANPPPCPDDREQDTTNATGPSSATTATAGQTGPGKSPRRATTRATRAAGAVE